MVQKYHHQRHLEKQGIKVSINQHGKEYLTEDSFGNAVFHGRGAERAVELSDADGGRGIELIENRSQHSAQSKLMSSDVSVSHGETKEVNYDGGSFVTDASSIVHEAISTATATRRQDRAGRRRLNHLRSLDAQEMKKDITVGNDEQFEKQQIDSTWNDCLYLEVQYGMEIGELLEKYSLHRDQVRNGDE